MSNNAGFGKPEKAPEEEQVDFKSSRTLIIIILIGIAIAIFAGSRANKGAPAVSEGVNDQLSFLYYAMVALPWAILLLIGYLFYTRVKADSVHRFNHAIVLMNAGKLDEAEAEFQSAAVHVKNSEFFNGFLAFHLALLKAYRGNYAPAIEEMRPLTQTAWFKKMDAGIQTTLWGYLIQSQIFAGQTQQASINLEKLSTSTPMADNALLKERFFLRVREGKYEAALKLAESEWREIEAMMSPHFFKLSRLVWAFAQYKTNAPTAQWQQTLAATRPFWKGQYEPLFSAWPEMLEFLRVAGLTDDLASV